MHLKILKIQFESHLDVPDQAKDEGGQQADANDSDHDDHPGLESQTAIFTDLKVKNASEKRTIEELTAAFWWEIGGKI